MDYAHDETDKIIDEITQRLREEYDQAQDEVNDKLEAYFASFRRKDEEMRAKMEAGEITKTQYQGWRQGQLIVGRRWARLQHELARDMFNTNMIAREIIYGFLPDIWALNHNFAAYEVEKAFGIDLGFTLYDHKAVAYLMNKNPQILPMPSPKRLRELKEAGETLWESQKIISVMMQAILQGESIPNMAKRISQTLGTQDYNAAVRNARTMATATENAGRVEAYKEAKELGAEGYQEWVAVHDARTRHQHREADGQKIQVGEKFIVDGYEMEAPADPTAPAYLVYNCRCHIKFLPKGLEPRAEKRRVIAGYDSYEEWKAGKYDPKRDKAYREQRRKNDG